MIYAALYYFNYYVIWSDKNVVYHAEKVLPQWLVDEVRNYISNGLIYIPPAKPLRKEWGSKSGIKELLAERNNEIRYKKSNGMTISQLAVEYHLSEETIKRILYR